MPIYEYRCENGHLFEVMQKITDEPVTECETCGAPVSACSTRSPCTSRARASTTPTTARRKRKRETDKSATDGADKHDAKQAEKKARQSSSSDSSVVVDLLGSSSSSLLVLATDIAALIAPGANRHWRLGPRAARLDAMTPRHVGLLAALAAIWGGSYLLIKYALEDFARR